MSDSKKVYIFGYSGHSYVLIESMLSQGITVAGYFDKKEAHQNPFNITYFGNENEVDVKKIIKSDFVFPAVGENNIRKKMCEFFTQFNLNQFVLIDPSANVSPTAQIGFSTYIGKNTCVNAFAIIKEGVVVNTGSVVEHECVVEKFSHIAPNATLLGNVNVGFLTFFGAGAVAKQGVKIGNFVTVGAGSVVLKNIEDKEIWVGVPAKKIIK